MNLRLVLLLMGVLFCSGSQAAKPTPSSKVFTMMLKREYDEAFFRITPQGSEKAVCKTQSFPFYKAKSDPLAGLDWKKLEKESKNKEEISKCKQLVGFDNQLTEKHSTLVTCLTQEHTQFLFKQISERCRAGI